MGTEGLENDLFVPGTFTAEEVWKMANNRIFHKFSAFQSIC